MGRLSSVGTHLHFNPAPILRNICLHACHTFTCPTKFQTQSQDAGTPRGRPDEGQEGGGDDGGTVGRGVEVAKAPRTHSAFCSHRRVSSRYSTAAWRNFLGSIASSVFCKAVKEGSESVPQVRPHTGTILPGGRPCLSDPLGWCRTGASNKRC